MEEKKKIAVIGGVAVFSIIVVLVFLQSRNMKKIPPKAVIPTEELIPTVDSSVRVDLKTKIPGQEVTLTVEGIPNGSESFEYSLSYETKQQGTQGVIGTVVLDASSSSYEKDITLGTCSSGKCVYHEVVGKVMLSLKFVGSYGERIFEKEYSL
ncbi:hypothetical protein COT62_01485 [Candidatus Roizmanbacteria bacterium CG09_land_8_20_14_0_10_41_9]|uniref:Uncharacterized protein n=1 Tax=Candidatus Roizmanbacteria bacterium CG09_land_8_20_14_0_10_41_9 TaxID=1974850 RepID=A0A2H0WTA7_9BACT|nr:MAG: hypothetical protein COT62_01485 [Candidatus Roizmanbacteria bacterium CG09_land_8_20_14_0_10_41_9]